MKIDVRLLGLFLLCVFAFSIVGCFLRRDQDEDEPEDVIATVVSVTPASGTTISPDATITVTFDYPPDIVIASTGTVSVAGNIATITGPFTPGAFVLTFTWGDGDYTVNYTVLDPEPKSEPDSSPEETDPPDNNSAIGEVLIYTGEVWWITQKEATAEAKTTERLLKAADIQTEITDDKDYVEQWMLQTTQDGAVDIAIFYGPIPTTIYPAGNTRPNGSVIEEWIETSDGNTILNHADWFGFWADGDINVVQNDDGERREGLLGVQNGAAALQNIMDIPGITMWEANTPMEVTDTGRKLTPSLVDFRSDRPFHLNELRGEWFAEKVFASNTGDEKGTRADPVIVRDGERGRIAIVHQTDFEDNPKGEVAAEIIINYLQNN